MNEPNAVDNPYAAPRADLGSIQAGHAAQLDYRSQGLVVGILISLLVLQALGHAVGAAACAFLLTGPAPEIQHQVVELTRVTAPATNGFHTLGLIPFAMFLFRTNKNARAFVALAPPETQALAPVLGYTPASMIWWFFVPIMNLFRPYQAVQAVWEASTPENADLASMSQGGVLSLWWGTFLATTIWNQVNTTYANTVGKADPATHNTMAIITSLIGVAGCVCALRLVMVLDRRQAACAANIR